MRKSLIRKHSLLIAGRKTSVSLEDAFWHEVKRMAKAAKLPTGQFVASLDGARDHINRSSALRLAVVADLNKTIRAFDRHLKAAE
jgi:predicted DNA-binding ribbon-helix-helix protein